MAEVATLGLNNPERDFDACGVGLTTGKNAVVEALKMSSCYVHRGAENTVGVGDGAGIVTGLPKQYYSERAAALGVDLKPGEFGIGSLFLSKDEAKNKKASELFRKALNEHGLDHVASEDIEYNANVVSKATLEILPDMKRFYVPNPGMDEAKFEKALHKASVTFNASIQNTDLDASITSLSNRLVVYKGTLTSDKVPSFFKDFDDVEKYSRGVEWAGVHSRFATNTTPTAASAQPFGALFHNGEINTIYGNIEFVKAVVKETSDTEFAYRKGLSDSGRTSLYLEHLMHEKDMSPYAAVMMIKPYPGYKELDSKYHDIFEVFKHIQPTFDGPANFVFYDGKVVGASLDRGGLRPARLTIMKDGNIRYGSEEGIIEDKKENVEKRSSLRGGEIWAYDLEKKQYLDMNAVLDRILEEGFQGKPFSELAKTIKSKLVRNDKQSELLAPAKPDLDQRAQEVAYGWHKEAVDMHLIPMARDAKVNVVAMGRDIPDAVFSKIAYHPTSYMYQKFAQVTNPPIDSIRERANMSLESYLGGNPLVNEAGKVVTLKSPNLREGQLNSILNDNGLKNHVVDATYDPSKKSDYINAINNICNDVVKAVRENGSNNIVVTDRYISKEKQALPDVILVAAIKERLKDEGLSLRTSITCETHQAYNEHQVAMLLQCGADAIDAPLMRDKIKSIAKYSPQLLRDSKHSEIEPDKYMSNLYKALDDGLLKIMAKMGINEVEAYKNQKLFETVGLASEGIQGKAFSGASMFLQGHGDAQIEENFSFWHSHAVRIDKEKSKETLPNLGIYSVKQDGTGETHLYSQNVTTAFADMLGEEAQKRIIREKLPEFEKEFEGKPAEEKRAAIEKFMKNVEDQHYAIGLIRGDIIAQNFVAKIKGAKEVRATETPYTADEINIHEVSDAYRKFEEKVNGITAESPSKISHMLHFKKGTNPIPLEEVEPASDIIKRLLEGGISYGANTDVAKASAALAFNRVGGKSNTGEGGEPSEVWGTMYNNKKKQVASGRNGLSAEYLVNAEEIEIKVAQGAKPGEGGQLPANKLSVEMAIKRRAIPGTEQISPPPHHDVYSIEDITQLIHDIRSICDSVSIKIVSSDGVDTISSGLTKALLASGLNADMKAGGINIAGGTGGTGASPITSIYHAGLPNEIGLVQTNQGLEGNKLREVTDINSGGGLITAKDIAMNTVLGANYPELGTTIMILQDCVMARLCGDACPIGVATHPELFAGDHRNIEQFLMNTTHQLREYMADLGIKKFDDLIGRTDLVDVKMPEYVRGNVDLSKLLHSPEKQKLTEQEWDILKEKSAESKKRSDDFLLTHSDVIDVVEGKKKHAEIEMERPLCNKDRSFGIRTSGFLSTKISVDYAAVDERKRLVDDDAITVHTYGTGGQSYGAFNTSGLKLVHTGILQDGVGKSATGGTIVARSADAKGRDVVAGNACFFGAGSVKGYMNGRVGDRLCIRGSGMDVVVEGVGDFAGEYASQGCIVNLGKAGKEVGIGSSGLIFMQFDPKNKFKASADMEVFKLSEVSYLKEALVIKLQEHLKETGSKTAKKALDLINGDPEKAAETFKVAISREILKERDMKGINNIKKVMEKMPYISPAFSSHLLKMTYDKMTTSAIGGIS